MFVVLLWPVLVPSFVKEEFQCLLLQYRSPRKECVVVALQTESVVVGTWLVVVHQEEQSNVESAFVAAPMTAVNGLDACRLSAEEMRISVVGS